MATRKRSKGKRRPEPKATEPLREEQEQAAGAEPPPPSGELLDMSQAMEMLRISRPTFYRWLRQGRIKGMKVGRQWRFYREDVERFLRGQEPRIDLPADLSPLIRTLKEKVEALGAQDVAPPDVDDTVHAASLMIRLAVAMEASDLHIEPHRCQGGRGAEAVVRCRVDGVMHTVAELDIRLLPAIDERWKAMAACDVHEKTRPQDGRILIRLADCGKEIDLRVSFVHAVLGPSLCARILDPEVVRPLDIDGMGYARRDRERLLAAIQAPFGLVLVVGPTGCGKTTTLYACIQRLATPDRKVMTVEDPVEFLLPGIVQTTLRQQHGFTFPVAIRSFLRSATNVMMVGEIRDPETAHLVCQASLTGHMVLATLHTQDAAQALTRMVEIGVDPFVVADATRLVLAQRLIRKLCTACAGPATPPASHLEEAAGLARAGGLEWASLPKDFRGPVGCEVCHQTGFRGREVIAEALELSPEIGQALRSGAGTDELRALAVRQGMTTMAADGIRRAAAGATSIDEALRVLRGG